jgi:hypothetical protein
MPTSVGSPWKETVTSNNHEAAWAKKAVYGFSEAARLVWVALKGHLESDG